MPRSISAERALTVLLDRRAFLAGSGAAGLLAASPVGAAVTARPAPPVCAWHNDQPYHDETGAAAPYRPPAGLRGGEALAALDETARRYLAFYL